MLVASEGPPCQDEMSMIANLNTFNLRSYLCMYEQMKLNMDRAKCTVSMIRLNEEVFESMVSRPSMILSHDKM